MRSIEHQRYFEKRLGGREKYILMKFMIYNQLLMLIIKEV